MSGHSHWKQIQHKKGTADQKRGRLFSKLLAAIAIAARQETNPDFNPRLRSAVEKAKQNSVPGENIERAVKKAAELKNLEEITIEAYGPEKSAMIIEAITDNRNRTISEIRHLLEENKAKMADPRSVLWSFDPPTRLRGRSHFGEAKAREIPDWRPKFRQSISEEGQRQLRVLMEKLEEHNDVQKIITNSL